MTDPHQAPGPAHAVSSRTPEPPARASLRRNAGHMFTSQLFTWALATLISVIVPRHLGPDAVGQLRLVTSLWAIGAIATALGTSRLVQLEVAREPTLGLRLIGPVLVTRTLAFVVMCATVLLYAAVVEGDRTILVVAAIGAVTTLFVSLSEGLADGFIGLERMAVPATALALGKLLNMVAVLMVVATDGNVYGVAGAGAVASIVAFVYVAWRFRTIGRLDFSRLGEGIRRSVRGGVPFLAVAVALILYQQIDVIVISWVGTSTDIGWYGTADALFGSLMFPATVLMASVFPMLGRLGQHDPGSVHALIERTFLMLIVAGVPIGLGTVLVGPSFAPVLYGAEYAETGTVLAVLGPVVVLSFITTLFGTIAMATGRNRAWVTLLLAAAAVTVVLDIILVPWASDEFENGAVGGALAYVVTEAIQVVVGFALVGAHLLRRAIGWRVARVLLAGGVMFLAGWPVRDEFVLLPAAVCAGVYGLAVWMLRIPSPEDRELLRALRNRLPRRRTGG